MRPMKSQCVAGSDSLLLAKEEMIELLFSRYHHGLVKRASSVVGELFAEEIVQDTWLTLLLVWDTIRDKELIRPWLNKVVLNKSLNRLKKENRITSVEQVISIDDTFCHEFESRVAPLSDEPERILSFEEKLLEVEASWYRLTTNQKSVCELRFIHGYKYEQIADRLGVSISNSKVILHRAKASLTYALR